jgi:hypothetical protein
VFALGRTLHQSDPWFNERIFVKTKFAVLFLLAFVCVEAFASGAPWYKWMNRSDRTIICAQISPGENWVKYQGPFMESQCKKPGNPQ